MKIKVIKKKYDELIKIKPKKQKPPIKPNIFFRTLIKLISLPALTARKFKYNKEVLKSIPKKTPCLFLMNHSSFIDLEIAESILYPRVFNIVCTNDGFVGKNWLMRQIGCINTPKYVVDTPLVKKMINIIKKKRSILMYPEACYSFDGTASTMPNSLAKLIKLLNVDVVTIISSGAYLHQPLYNELRKRKVNINAKTTHLFKKDEIKDLTEDEILKRINNEFSFDNFLHQQQNNIIIDEKERAVGLNRILYKCPHCKKEGVMNTKDEKIFCTSCGANYILKENGFLESTNKETIFNHIPTWYKWQKEEVKKEILNDQYLLDIDCDIYVMIDTYHLYDIGSGHLKHNKDGFLLTNSEGLNFFVANTYSINADFYWYQLGDIICVADYNKQFYVFPKGVKDVVAKTKIACELFYQLSKSK